MKKPIKWAYGVTTVPQRIENHLLTRTLKSLAAGGFDDPCLFVDGTKSLNKASMAVLYGSRIVYREPELHLTGNWILALWELYLRDPTCHRYVIFQDDVVVCKGLRDYLETCSYEPKHYYNLITYEQNEPLAEGRNGWFYSNQRGRGAQALMFDRQTVIDLLGSRHLADRMQNAKRGPQAVDGAVCNSLKPQKYRELVHNPSLIAHTGSRSVTGHPTQKCGDTFPGEDYVPMLGNRCSSVSVMSLARHRGKIGPREMLDLLGRTPILVEIGCHDGDDTAQFLAKMPGAKIHCFDPEKRALERFKTKIGDDPRVRLFESAVADIDGEREFFASTWKNPAHQGLDWDYSGSLCQPTMHLERSPTIAFKEPVLLPCMKLDTWHANVGKPEIDFVWADVQGSQRLVIAGAQETLPHVKYLYIESHSPPLYDGEPTQQELIDILAEWFLPIAIYQEENVLFERKT